MKTLDGDETMAGEQQDVFSLYILKIKPDSLRQAETFLRNRKWIVGSGTNLREALAYIIQKKPEFILLAADHPNKKVKILPKLLAQAFPVKVISFAESQSGTSIANLHEMGMEYSLFPPVSGPSIERIVLKMRRDEQKKAEEAAERKRMGLDDGNPDEVIRLKGEEEGGPSAGPTSFEQARAALSQLVSNDGDEAAPSGPGSFIAKGDQGPGSQSGSSGSGIGYMGGSEGSGAKGGSGIGYMGGGSGPGTGGAGGGSGIGYMGGVGGTDPTGSGAPGSGIGYMGGMGGPQGAAGSMGPGATPAPHEGPAEGESFAEWEERMRKMAEARLAEMQAKKASGSGDDQPVGESDDPNSPTFHGGQNRGPASPQFGGAGGNRRGAVPNMEYDPVTGKQKLVPKYKGGGSNAGRDNDSIIVKGTQNALDESVNVRDDLQEYTEIEKASHCACIIVESERFSGYLVAALGKDRKIDKSFMDMIKQRLFSFLKAHGEIVKDDESMAIKIQEVEFEDWALEQADFLKKSIHDGDEIAMAFFPTKETSIRLEESVSEKMLMMNIEELKEDTAVEFDLYIYMPENNKYLLYTPEGQTLYGKQRSRLLDKGVKQMHLRKESAHNVKKYRAQNFLNEKIAAFRQAQKIKNG